MSHQWDSSNIPDQTGRTVVVTGANTGIGYEAARVLANKKAHVILAVRSLEKGNVAAEKIRAQNDDANVSVMTLDLADLSSIGKFSDDFKHEHKSLDLLINNAGVMLPPYSKTKDGFEIQFGTNHLGHFALTGLLIETMKHTAGSRIVNISSIAHKSGNIQFDDLNWETRKY
jgi:NAD(P)-dependent dehydrogenase (short-subunit alcohol dehydrogenase family)